MFGIILNSYLSSMSGHKFHDDFVMQTRNILLLMKYIISYLLKSVQDVNDIL